MMRIIWLTLGVCVIAGCASQRQVVWPEMTPVNSMPTVQSAAPIQGIASPETVTSPPQAVTPPEPTPTKTAVSSPASTESPIEASGSPAQIYDREVIATIQKHWHELRSNYSTNADHGMGKVVIAFRVHSDGRISNVKTVSSNVSSLLTYLCQRAVTDPAPYPRWPSEMVRQFGEENRLIRFTFSYE